jgi:hypothetical protein
MVIPPIEDFTNELAAKTESQCALRVVSEGDVSWYGLVDVQKSMYCIS